MSLNNYDTQWLVVAAQMSGSGKTELGVSALTKLRENATLVANAVAQAKSFLRLKDADLSEDIARLENTKLVFVDGRYVEDLQGADLNTVCNAVSMHILRAIGAVLPQEKLEMWKLRCRAANSDEALGQAGLLLDEWDFPVFIAIDEFDYLCGLSYEAAESCAPDEIIKRLYHIRNRISTKLQRNGWPLYIAGRGSYLYVMGQKIFGAFHLSPLGVSVQRLHLPPLNIDHIFNILASTLAKENASLPRKQMRDLARRVFRLTRGVARLVTWVANYIRQHWSNIHPKLIQGQLSEKSFSEDILSSLYPAEIVQLTTFPASLVDYLLSLIRFSFYKLPIQANADAPQTILEALGLTQQNQASSYRIPMSECLRYMNVHFMSCNETGQRHPALRASSASVGHIDSDASELAEPPAKRQKLGDEAASLVPIEGQQQIANDDVTMMMIDSSTATPALSRISHFENERIYVRVFFPQLMLDALTAKFSENRAVAMQLGNLAEYARRFDKVNDIEILRTGVVAERFLVCLLFNHLSLAVWMADSKVPLAAIFPFLRDTEVGSLYAQPLALSPFPSFRVGNQRIEKTVEGEQEVSEEQKALIKSLTMIRKQQVNALISEFEFVWKQPCFPAGSLLRCRPQSRSCDVLYKVDDTHMVGFACKSSTSPDTAYGVNTLISELEKGFIPSDYFKSCKSQIIVAVFLQLQNDLSDLERYNDTDQPRSISWANLNPNSTQSERFELLRDETGKVIAFRFKPGFEFQTTAGTSRDNKKTFIVPERGEVFVFTNAGLEQFFGAELLMLLRGSETNY